MQGTGSVTGGECKLTPEAEYEVLGKTDYDQRWIDETTEGLIAGCKRPRPKARPPELDQPRRVITPVIKPAPKEKPRKRWFGIKKPAVAGLTFPMPRVKPELPKESAPQIVEQIEPPSAGAQIEPQIPPKDDLDELLAVDDKSSAPIRKRKCLWQWLC